MDSTGSIIETFETVCHRYPDNTALICKHTTLSYSELLACVRAWSSAIDQTLNASKSNNKVLIYLDKSLAYVEAIYATLSQGGTYIPVDATQPIERVQLIIEQAQPDIIITTALRKETLEPLLTDKNIHHHFLTLEGFESNKSQYQQNPIEPFVKPDPSHIAAILFTSGSTGVPKGVQITHQNLSYFIDWAVTELKITDQDCLSNHAPFAFDLSTFDLFAAGTTGAASWIITHDQQRDVKELSHGIKNHGVSIWYSVPSVLSMMINAGALTTSNNATLRHVIFAGEPFSLKGLAALKAALPNETSLYNWYGPTETNVCFSHKVTDDDFTRSSLPIGAPLPGLDAILLPQETQDKHHPNQHCGELLISGPCVTPGYMNVEKPEITAHHKVHQHPTGDLVILQDNLYFYQGRLDDMVKINGNRVELGEISNCIDQLPTIKQSVVIYTEGTETPKLIVFATLNHQDSKVNILQIKKHVSTQLPKYMIPNSLVILHRFPLNPNGKVDKKALKTLALEG